MSKEDYDRKISKQLKYNQVLEDMGIIIENILIKTAKKLFKDKLIVVVILYGNRKEFFYFLNFFIF
jgi:hypothetical protein